MEVSKSGAAAADSVTTLVIWNLPKRMSQMELAAHVDDDGFHDKYDFLYMPRAFDLGKGSGNAFINFCTAAVAARFKAKWQGKWLPRMRVNTKLKVGVATTQGLAANMINWRSSKTSRIENPKHRPLIRFASSSLEVAGNVPHEETDSWQSVPQSMHWEKPERDAVCAQISQGWSRSTSASERGEQHEDQDSRRPSLQSTHHIVPKLDATPARAYSARRPSINMPTETVLYSDFDSALPAVHDMHQTLPVLGTRPGTHTAQAMPRRTAGMSAEAGVCWGPQLAGPQKPRKGPHVAHGEQWRTASVSAEVSLSANPAFPPPGLEDVQPTVSALLASVPLARNAYWTCGRPASPADAVPYPHEETGPSSFSRSSIAAAKAMVIPGSVAVVGMMSSPRYVCARDYVPLTEPCKIVCNIVR